MIDENDIDDATKMAETLIDQLDQEEDAFEHNKKSMDGSHEMLKVLAKSIQDHIDTIKSNGCDCPVCASTMDQLENTRKAVQEVEMGSPLSVTNPMEASFILGTASCLCAFMPAMIAAMLQINTEAHETVAAVITSRMKLVPCADDNTENDSINKPN